MKKVLIVLYITICGLYAIPDMPPMPPIMQTNAEHNTSSKKTNSHKRQPLSSIADCKILPPMIIFLPPPMEKALISCRNQYFRPSIFDVNEKLSKILNQEIKATSVQIVEGFREVYKITTNKGIKYCNKDISFCLDNSSSTAFTLYEKLMAILIILLSLGLFFVIYKSKKH